MKINLSTFVKGALLIALVFSAADVNAQRKKKKGDDVKKEAPSKDAPKKIEDLIKNSASYEGLFTIYQDSTTGATKLLIKADQIGKEFIYFSQIADGNLAAGGFRGSYRGSKVFKIEKYFNKIEFITQNTSSYFDPENALSKAKEANMPNAIMASLKIEGVNDDESEFLIDGDAIFLKEILSQIKPPNFPGSSPFAFKVGNLDKEKTKVNAIRSYPENTDLAIEYVYSSPSALNGGGRDVTDPRNVSIKVYHSLIQMPDDSYVPLIDDPRVGYFLTQVTDMTSPENANYRDLVHRWRLVKKDPNAEISEPVEPIVWWMENTTPENLRPLIKTAAEQWNIAFEKAGFKNALVVKQQPDDADWDAGDIRYNVLRWTASPTPPFGGYGPSFVNPRTGEILGADIMFEYRSVLGRLRVEDFFSEINSTELLLKENEEEMHQFGNCQQYGCTVSDMAAVNNAFAGLILEYMDGTSLEDSKMIKEFIHYLILHEIGHTLGLNHNMKASNLHSLKTVHNTQLTGKDGLIGSVMDYPSINAALNRSQQGHYYTMRPGPYDLWAIQFAYENGRSEEETTSLLNRSTEHQLLFGNDADDMRAPGKAIDPRVNIFDLTSDAIQYGVERLMLVDTLANEMMEKYNEKGDSYHDHLVAYYTMNRQYRDFASVTSRFVGGVYIDRAMIGQKGATKPYIPVELKKQKEAMNAMSTYLFAPDAMDFANEMYQYLQPQRRGFGFFSQSEDPKVHTFVSSVQMTALSHLLHPNTLERVVNSELYGNEYDLSNMMSDLTDAIFKVDINGNVNTFRHNLQKNYTKMLIAMVTGKRSASYMPVIQSHAVYTLKQIRRMAASGTGNIATKAHKQHLTTLIDNALKEIK